MLKFSLSLVFISISLCSFDGIKSNQVEVTVYPKYYSTNRDAIILLNDSVCHLYAYRNLRMEKTSWSVRRAVRKGYIDNLPMAPHYKYHVSGTFPYKISHDTLTIEFVQGTNLKNYYSINENQLIFLREISYADYANKKNVMKLGKEPRWLKR